MLCEFNLKYKIDIWVYGCIRDTYESENVQDVLKWYRSHWYGIYNNVGCIFEVYEYGNRLSFDE